MADRKTPGVYISEEDAFPPTAVPIRIGLPAFVGYTERAAKDTVSLHMVPTIVSTRGQFEALFGGPPKPLFDIMPEPAPDALPAASFETGGQTFHLISATPSYALHPAIFAYFENGGGPCCIISVGRYGDKIEAGLLLDGIATLAGDPAPDLLVVPDTTRLSATDSGRVHQQMLANCAADGNRVAILDMRHGFATRDGPTADPVAAFRNTVGSDNLEFGAAYYPWLQLPLFSENDFTYENIAPASHNLFASLMASDLRARNATEGAMQLAQILLTIDKIRSIASSKTASPSEQGQLHDALSGSSDLYRAVMSAIATRENTQSPGGFMTGLNAGGDDMIGPWDLPAHSTLAMALKPSVTISRSEEMDLNSAADGKMVNTIRGFNARGMVIGEAQTLGGGYSDWRYFAARKTVSVIEQDLRTAIAAYATDDNDLNTWAAVQATCEDYLTKMWRDRELQGSHASNAFSVRVGLGDTMTVQDIVDGTLRVVAYLAPVYPNEYTVLTLEQPMERP